jgi:predicted nucleic acid-binding protein
VILDTNALSAVADGDTALEPLLQRASRLSIPVIVLGEHRYGISQSRERSLYEQWLIESLPDYSILLIDEETAIHYAAVRAEMKKAGTPIPSNDAWIAALCRQYALPLLSRDAHFDSVSGLRRIAW